MNKIFKQNKSKSFIYDVQKNKKIDYDVIHKKNILFSKLIDKKKSRRQSF